MSPRTFHRKPSSQLSTPLTPTPSTFRFSPHSHHHDDSFLTTPTTPDDDEDDDQRWSEIIPPKTALAFSPVWDPDHDTVQFTQAQLQLLSTPSLNAIDLQISPSDAVSAPVSSSASVSGLVGSDNVSQVLSIGNSTLTLPLSDSDLPTSTLQYFQDQYRDYLFSGPSSRVCHGERGSTTENYGHRAEPGDHGEEQWENEEKATSCRRRKITRTQTSSTMDGFDVYLRGSLMANAHDIKNNSKKNRYFSCLEYFLDEEFEFDPRTPFARQYAEGLGVEEGCRDRDNEADDCVSDEGFFEVSGLGSRKGIRHHERQRPQSRPKPMVRETTNATANPSNANSPPSTSNISEFMSITLTDLQENDEEEEDDTSSQWSALDPPEYPSPTYAQLLIADQQRNSLRGGRLRKRRPSGLPAPPVEVLQREVFSHQVSVPVPGPAQSMLEGLKGRKRGGSGNHSDQCQTLNNIVHRLGRKKSSVPAVERWMCVEVTQEVRWAS